MLSVIVLFSDFIVHCDPPPVLLLVFWAQMWYNITADVVCTTDSRLSLLQQRQALFLFLPAICTTLYKGDERQAGNMGPAAYAENRKRQLGSVFACLQPYVLWIAAEHRRRFRRRDDRLV